MRLLLALLAILAAGGALAQDKPAQSKIPTEAQTTGPQTTGQGSSVGQAPIGHLQPRAADLPSDVRDIGARPTPAQEEFDKKLRICRGC